MLPTIQLVTPLEELLCPASDPFNPAVWLTLSNFKISVPKETTNISRITTTDLNEIDTDLTLNSMQQLTVRVNSLKSGVQMGESCNGKDHPSLYMIFWRTKKQGVWILPDTTPILMIDDHLTFSQTVDEMISKCNRRIDQLRQLTISGMNTTGLQTFFCCNIRSGLTYVALAWISVLSHTDKAHSEKVQGTATFYFTCP